MKVYTTALIAFLLLLLINVDATIAGNPDYSLIEYSAVAQVVVDGEWTTDNEWVDAPITEMSDNTYFGYNVIPNDWIMQLIIEIFDDDTDDAGDYWQICIDDNNDGGSVPQADDFRIDIVGHTDLVFYQGNGAGWEEITPDAGEITWTNAITGTPLESNPHWILELTVRKTVRVAPSTPPTGLRVAVYDASNPGAGVRAWAPDSDPDIPDEWGVISEFSEDPYVPGNQVATPTFSPAPGTYSSVQSVSISCSTSGATIRYTLDGSTPNSSSTLYSSPISVTDGEVTIKAVAFRSGLADSSIASGTYSIVSNGSESNQIDLSIEEISTIISLCAVSVGAGGWLFRKYSARKRHKILFTKLMEDIDYIYTRYKMNTLRCETELYKSKNQVLEDFKQGLIDEEKYKLLDARIDNYLKEIEEKTAKERSS